MHNLKEFSLAACSSKVEEKTCAGRQSEHRIRAPADPEHALNIQFVWILGVGRSRTRQKLAQSKH